MRLPLVLLFSKLDNASVLSLSSQDLPPAFLPALLLSPFKCLNILSTLWSPELHQCYTEQSNHLFRLADWLAMLWLLHPKMQFAAKWLAGRAHCGLMLSLLSTAPPGPFLLSCSPSSHSCSSLCLCLCLALLTLPQVQNLAEPLPLWNSMLLMFAQCSHLSRSLHKPLVPPESHISIVSKLARDAFNSCIQISDNSVEQSRL